MEIIANNKKYIATREAHGWALMRPVTVIDKKTKEAKEGFQTTYHSNLSQVLNEIADVEMGSAENVTELISVIKSLKSDITKVGA